jgi:hypothetical protein
MANELHGGPAGVHAMRCMGAGGVVYTIGRRLLHLAQPALPDRGLARLRCRRRGPALFAAVMDLLVVDRL